MNNFMNNAYFWQKVDTLFLSSTLVVSKKKGETHPVFKNLVYPVNYGHLVDTDGVNSEGISVYIGTQNRNSISAIVVAADILQKCIDVKILTGCTEDEITEILHFLNQTDNQKTVLIRRGNEIPNWGVSE